MARIVPLLVVLAIGALLVAAGCGGGTDSGTVRESTQAPRQVNSRHIHITLDGKAGPENVGVLMAANRGYFDDVGLDVEVTSPEQPFRPIEYVTTTLVELGISHEPEIVLARQEDQQIIAVGAVIPQPTAAMIWLRKSKIDGIADLKGKTIAIPGLRFQRDLLQSVLARAGLSLDDVKVKVVGYGLVSSLVRGRADASFGGSWNVEGAALEAKGLTPVVTRARNLGIPSYGELQVIARPAWLARNPKSARDFMSAMARGVAAARENPRAAAAVIAEGANVEGIEDRVKKTLPLLSATGHMSTRQANRLVGWIQGQGLIQRDIPASALLTNRYLKSEP